MNNIKLSTFGRVLIKYASSQVISNVLRILAGFLVVALVDPTDYGLYTGIGVYIGYFQLGHLGIINGLGREFPFHLGRENDEYGRQLANTTFVVTVIIGSISALAFLGLSVYEFIVGESLNAFVYLAYVLVAGFSLINSQLLPVLYRTSSDFNKLSKLNIIFGLWNLLSVLLVWKFKITGLLLRGVILALIQFYLLYKNKPYKLKLKLIKQDVIHLLKTGLPIFMVGQVNPLWSTIVNNLIFVMGGARYFGLYALANIVHTTARIIPASFGQVIYPRMSIMYGQGKGAQEIIRLNLKPLFFQFVVMLLVSIVGIFLLPVIVPWILPKYVEGIRAAQWMFVVPLIYSFGAINNIFNVTGRQKTYFISLLTGTLVGTAYIFLRLMSNEFDLLVFPQGMIVGKSIQQLLSLFFAFRLK